MTTHLWVCADRQAAGRALARSRDTEEMIIIASDDPLVHEMAARAGARAVWHEDVEAFFDVAETVKEMTDAINRWLRSVADDAGLQRHLLFWVKHVEGGRTIQRVQDAVLLVRAYNRLLDATQPDRISIDVGASDIWSAELLRRCATTRGVPVRIVGHSRLAIQVARIRAALDTLAREPYALLSWIGAIRFGRRRAAGRGADIAIQLCDSAPKHVEYARLLLAAIPLPARGVAICWRASRGAKRLRSAGLAADDLERWVGVSDLAASILVALRCWGAARRRRAEFLALEELRYDGVALAEALWDSIRHFLLAEVASRYQLAVGAERYFVESSPRIVKFWTTVLPTAVIAWESIPTSHRPRVFHSPGFPYDFADPYRHRTIPVDIEFAISPHHRELLAGDGNGERTIVIVGHDRQEGVEEFRERVTVPQAREMLGVPNGIARVVLFDPGYVLLGYMSAKEQMAAVDAMLEVARADASVYIMIKPHPSHRAGRLEGQVARAALNNVSVTPSGALPLVCLRAADVLVTKYSTLGLEAMYMSVPVIAAILDGERRFRVFGDAAEYVETPQALRGRFTDLGKPGAFDPWADRMKSRAAEHLERATFRGGATPSRLTVEALLANLNPAWR